MPEGGTITIAARQDVVSADRAGELKPGDYICLSVDDTGGGMARDTLERAIEPFFTTKGIGKGTGLGLSMVHGFVTQSGGAFGLTSVVGKGTSAQLWLPVAQLASVLSEKPEAPREPAVERLQILVVDDDGLVLANTAAMLEDLGHEILEANCGEKALEVLRESSGIDLVVTDQLMPGMSGTELGAAIRAEQPNLPLIVASGYADQNSPHDATVVRLSKPFAQDQLRAAILAAVKSST